MANKLVTTDMVALVEELVEAHADSIETLSRVTDAGTLERQAHVDYLQSLIRATYALLARAA